MLMDGEVEQGNIKQQRNRRARDTPTASNRTGIILSCPRALHKNSSALLCELMMDFGQQARKLFSLFALKFFFLHFQE